MPKKKVVRKRRQSLDVLTTIDEHSALTHVPTSAANDGTTALVHKILFLSPNEKHPTITVLKDVIFGTILGVIILLSLLYLDFRNVIPLPGSVRSLRQSAFELIIDPETMSTMEEALDRAFIPMAVYEEIRDEISQHETAVDEMVKYGLSVYEKELEDSAKLEEGMDVIKKEREYLKARYERVVGLDKWCGSCVWKGRTQCDARMSFLMATYATNEMKGKLGIMDSGKCLNQ